MGEKAEVEGKMKRIEMVRWLANNLQMPAEEIAELARLTTDQVRELYDEYYGFYSGTMN